MAELTHLQLVLQGSVGEDHHLYREGGSYRRLGSGVQESYDNKGDTQTGVGEASCSPALVGCQNLNFVFYL